MNFGHAGNKGVVFSAPREDDPNNHAPEIQSIGTRDAIKKQRTERSAKEMARTGERAGKYN